MNVSWYNRCIFYGVLVSRTVPYFSFKPWISGWRETPTFDYRVSLYLVLIQIRLFLLLKYYLFPYFAGNRHNGITVRY